MQTLKIIGTNFSDEIYCVKRKDILLLMILSGVVLFSSTAFTQENPITLSLSCKGFYTTSAKLFTNPESPSIQERAQFTFFNDITGAEITLALRRINDPYQLSLTIGYHTKTAEDKYIAECYPTRVWLPVSDGFRFFPIEIDVNLIVPISSEDIKFTFGGGFGIYILERTLIINNIQTKTRGIPIGGGITIGSTFAYRVLKNLFVVGELKVRDPETKPTTVIEQTNFKYRGYSFVLLPQEIHSRINITGLSLGIGIMVEIF
jgi:hypothetical protein